MTPFFSKMEQRQMLVKLFAILLHAILFQLSFVPFQHSKRAFHALPDYYLVRWSRKLGNEQFYNAEIPKKMAVIYV